MLTTTKKLTKANGELDYTIDEFGQSWPHDIFPVRIFTLTEWSMDDEGITFDVDATRVIEAWISENEGDSERQADQDECKLIAKFLHTDDCWRKRIEEMCWQECQDEMGNG